jgi:hypothetical protein
MADGRCLNFYLRYDRQEAPDETQSAQSLFNPVNIASGCSQADKRADAATRQPPAHGCNFSD